MDWNTFTQYASYLALVVISGAAEYIHLAPMGTLVGVLGLVVGHLFGNGTTKAALSQLLTALKSSTVLPVETAQVHLVPSTTQIATPAIVPLSKDGEPEVTQSGGNK